MGIGGYEVKMNKHGWKPRLTKIIKTGRLHRSLPRIGNYVKKGKRATGLYYIEITVTP